MIKFDREAIKKEATENRLSNLDLIRNYGHPSYSIFIAQFSECNQYEIFIEIDPGRYDHRANKWGYGVGVRIWSIEEGADLETDCYHDQLMAECERTRIDLRSDIWRLVGRMIKEASQKAKAEKAKK